jgi:hypothetical protein
VIVRESRLGEAMSVQQSACNWHEVLTCFSEIDRGREHRRRLAICVTMLRAMKPPRASTGGQTAVVLSIWGVRQKRPGVAVLSDAVAA